MKNLFALALACLLGLGACAPTTVQGDLAGFNGKVKQLVDNFSGDMAGVAAAANDLTALAQSGAQVAAATAQKGCGVASIFNGFYQVAATISPKVAATQGDEAKAMTVVNAACATPASDPAATLQVAMSTVKAVKTAANQDPAIAVALQAASVPPGNKP